MPTAPVSPMLASVAPKPASAMKSVGAWPGAAAIVRNCVHGARWRWSPSATIEASTAPRKPPSSRLFPVVQTITGSGTKP
jgi:hypothetical protein